jgi:eukaryotic-like serine/threonine-protein kinase
MASWPTDPSAATEPTSMDRWEQIENAYHSARSLRGEDRSRFLDEQRGLDSEMRRAIEVLLEHDDVPNSFFDRPAGEWVADWESLVGRPTLLTGRSVGPYEVLERIGSGGMGHVYRARDRTLKREVALKVLPALFALDPDRLARFRREAQVLAALNHPNIAAIHEFEESESLQALVLELVEGPTLADRIAHGPIPCDEALAIARQIADALGAAHEQGVVHRDLKPANIKVRPDGTVKVLDFGLAKVLDPAVSAGGEPTTSPTGTSPAVIRMGILFGTAAYMSPEQAKGGPADKRSDVWAFGCVLYEMLTGKRAFGGEDVSDTLTAVLRDAPDWTAWPDSVPTHIRELVQECLQKNRKDRIADISTARFVMNGRRAAFTAAVPPRLAVRQRSWKSAALVATIAAVASIVGWSVRPADQKVADVTRFSISLGEDQPLQGRPSLAISPDGTQLVYAANRRLYLRSMSELEGRPIAGTESVPVTSPVFSPDGRSIAFWSGNDGALKRVAVSGGRAITICQANDPLGMTWSTDGLLFGQSQHGIMRVPAAGGTPEVVVSVNPGETAFAPQVLPGGRGTMFTLTSGAFFDKPRLVVQTSGPVERKTLIEGATDGRYLPTGHIVYAVAGNLLAVSFDVRSLQVTGTPVPVIEGVARTALTATGSVTGTAQWNVSRTGSLVYVPGPVSDSLFLSRLALLDRRGRTEVLPLQPRAYESPRFSPDGRSIAFAVNDGRNVDLWIYDLAGTTAARQLTLGGRNRFPTWSPDGQRVAFESDREGDLAIFAQRADSSSTAERLTKPDAGTSHIPESWSPRGDVLSFSVKASRFSLWILSLRDKQARAFADVESDIPAASAFSSDGRWIAYQVGHRSGADVRPTAFVQPFPATGGRYQVPNSGAGPLWSADGNELYYTAGPRRWVVARVTLHPSFAAGNPVGLPNGELQVWRPDWWRQHDVSRDGRRIGLIPSDKSLIPGSTRLIHVVLNWFEEIKQRVPVK